MRQERPINFRAVIIRFSIFALLILATRIFTHLVLDVDLEPRIIRFPDGSEKYLPFRIHFLWDILLVLIAFIPKSWKPTFAKKEEALPGIPCFFACLMISTLLYLATGTLEISFYPFIIGLALLVFKPDATSAMWFSLIVMFVVGAGFGIVIGFLSLIASLILYTGITLLSFLFIWIKTYRH